MNHFSNAFVSQDPYQHSDESNWQQLKKILLDLIELQPIQRPAMDKQNI